MRLWASVSSLIKGRGRAKRFLRSCWRAFYIFCNYHNTYCMLFHFSVQKPGTRRCYCLVTGTWKSMFVDRQEVTCLLVPDLKVYLYFLHYSIGWTRGGVACQSRRFFFKEIKADQTRDWLLLSDTNGPW